MHAISSYRGNRHRPPLANPQTGPITIHCAAKLCAQCKNTIYNNFYSWNDLLMLLEIFLYTETVNVEMTFSMNIERV